MNHEQISVMGEQAFNSIHGTLTKKAIGMLMILAYNLMDDNVFSSGRAEPQGQIIKDFLYEIHLKYTGLHTYALYLRAIQNLGVNCAQLGNAMHVPMFEPQLSAVSKLLELEHSKEPEYSRHMWKFGRLFDKNIMSVLQIKHCASFGLVLAYIVSETSDSNKEGPLKIAGLKDASQGDKDDARPIAARAMRLLRSETSRVEHAEEAAKGTVIGRKRGRTK
ncbi:coat protein [Tanacetum coccineum]